MSMRRAVPLLAKAMITASLFAAGAARAQDEWKEEGDKPPPADHPAAKKDKEREKEQEQAADDAKPTRFLLDLKIGPAFVLAARQTSGSTDFSLQLNVGYAIAHDAVTQGDAFYLTLSPYLIVGSDLTLVAPLGLQYDLPLKMIAYKGLYAYARASVGYAGYQPPQTSIDKGEHAIAVQPAIGARITFAERFHVGIEPFGLDVVHTFPAKSSGNADNTLVAFQIALFGGARF